MLWCCFFFFGSMLDGGVQCGAVPEKWELENVISLLLQLATLAT